MKLISMTDFVLEQGKTAENQISNEAWIDVILGYANFLKQPLTLSMFVPCDEDGNVLEKPHNIGLIDTYPTGSLLMDKSLECAIKYQQAKERVLFDGFYVEFNAVISPSGGYLDVGNLRHKAIETIVGAHLTLTPQALKQIGL